MDARPAEACLEPVRRIAASSRHIATMPSLPNGRRHSTARPHNHAFLDLPTMERPSLVDLR